MEEVAPKEPAKRERKKPAPIAGQEVPQPPLAKVKTTVDLTWEASQRLSLHSLALKKTKSEILETLINDNLRRFCIQDRSGLKVDEAA